MKGGYVLSRAQRDEVQLVVGEAEIQIMEDMFIGPVTQEEREGA